MGDAGRPRRRSRCIHACNHPTPVVRRPCMQPACVDTVCAVGSNSGALFARAPGTSLLPPSPPGRANAPRRKARGVGFSADVRAPAGRARALRRVGARSVARVRADCSALRSCQVCRRSGLASGPAQVQAMQPSLQPWWAESRPRAGAVGQRSRQPRPRPWAPRRRSGPAAAAVAPAPGRAGLHAPTADCAHTRLPHDRRSPHRAGQ